MKAVLQILAIASLATIFAAAYCYYAEVLAQEAMKQWILGATIAWFAAATPLMTCLRRRD